MSFFLDCNTILRSLSRSRGLEHPCTDCNKVSFETEEGLFNHRYCQWQFATPWITMIRILSQEKELWIERRQIDL